MNSFNWIIVIVVAIIMGLLSWGLSILIEVRKENSSIFEKNSHWLFSSNYEYSKKVDTIIHTFLKQAIEIKKYKYCIGIHTKDKVLFVWTANKWYGYAFYIRICDCTDIYTPWFTLDDYRPSYHTMCIIESLENSLDNNFHLVANGDE